jgi:hypothetical protein
MTVRSRRILAAVGTVVIAAAINVTTGMLTQKWALAWGIATAVLVVLGGGVQAWLALGDRASDSSRVSASGAGGIAAAGSINRASTRVALQDGEKLAAPGTSRGGGEVNASGLGAIASGGDIRDAHTHVIQKGPVSP